MQTKLDHIINIHQTELCVRQADHSGFAWAHWSEMYLGIYLLCLYYEAQFLIREGPLSFSSLLTALLMTTVLLCCHINSMHTCKLQPKEWTLCFTMCYLSAKAIFGDICLYLRIGGAGSEDMGFLVKNLTLCHGCLGPDPLGNFSEFLRKMDA